MRGRGHADGDCVQVQGARPACLQARVGGGKNSAIALLAQRFGGERIGIRDGSEAYPGLLQLAIDAQMIAAKSSRAENGDG